MDNWFEMNCLKFESTKVTLYFETWVLFVTINVNIVKNKNFINLNEFVFKLWWYFVIKTASES